MIADITIPFFEWWWVPTLITIGSIAFYSTCREKHDGGTIGGAFGMWIINWFIAGIAMIVPLVSWVIYFVIKNLTGN